MRKFYLFIFILVVFFLQYSVLGVFFRDGRIPNLFAALAASLGLIFGFKKSVGWVVFAGFLLDAGSSWPVGTGTLALVLILWLVDKLKVFAELRSKRNIFIFFVALLALASTFFFDALLKLEIGAAGYVFKDAAIVFSPTLKAGYFWKLAYSALAGMGIYHFSRYSRNRFSPVFAPRKNR